MFQYQHRQSGTAMIALFAGASVILLLFSAKSSIGYPGFIVVIGLVVAGIFFSSLSIEVSDESLRWTFGPGLLSKEVSLADIACVETTRTRFWEGWGIRWTLRGWLYNVSGFDAVLVRLHSGKQFLLGTDEPNRLMRILQTAIPANK